MEVEEKTLPANDNSDENNSKKEKILTLLFPPETQPAEGKETRKDKNKPQTKVVVRRLPPRFTKEAFIEEFSPLPAHDYFHFVRGDLNLGSHAFSRAYINFLNQEDIFSFKEKYDDYDLQDEKGRTYHAVVEFASFQKIPKRNVIKKKSSKAGTLESDPKYIEFLQKLEESKNFINNPSEYFHETENSSLKAKVITTPLLEFLKRKRQKKIDLRNEIRQRKREAEREKKRKEEEKRKAEREKRKEEKKNSGKTIEEKREKIEERLREKRNLKEERKESKNRKNLEKNSVSDEKLDAVIPNDPAILEVVVRRSDKESKSGMKTVTKSNEETKSVKSNEGNELIVGQTEKKYSDFRGRIPEDQKQGRKTFYNKRDGDESKLVKSAKRKGVPDEKGDNYSVGNCGGDVKEAAKKSVETDSETGKRYDCGKVEAKETKSKFRYSEQRNRDREYRQKASDYKNPRETENFNAENKNKLKQTEERGTGNKASNPNREEQVKKSNSEPHVAIDGGIGAKISTGPTADSESISHGSSRRKSLEIDRKKFETERKRSKSFHDVTGKESGEFEPGLGNKSDVIRGMDADNGERIAIGSIDNRREGNFGRETSESDKAEDEEAKKDPRTGRRIRNKRIRPCDCHPTCTFAKDRPSIEIYRPGMGKFSKQRLEQKKDDSNCCTSPTGNSFANKSNRFGYKSNVKKSFPESGKNSFKGDESGQQKSGDGSDKCQSEVRTMTFNRSASKEN